MLFLACWAFCWPLWNLSDLQSLCLIEGNDCFRLWSFIAPQLNNLVQGSLRLYLLEATTFPRSMHKCARRGREHRRPEGKKGVNHLLLSHCQDEGERVQIGWSVCVRAGVGLVMLCRRGGGRWHGGQRWHRPPQDLSLSDSHGWAGDRCFCLPQGNIWLAEPNGSPTSLARPHRTKPERIGREIDKERRKKLQDSQFAPKAHKQVSLFLSSQLHPPLAPLTH